MVGQLRYDVTVREMGLTMTYADHVTQTVIEPLDHTGRVLAAWAGDRVVGTVRINLLRDCCVAHYRELYSLGRFPPQTQPSLSITTRLAVAPDYRNGRLFLHLATECYRYGLDQGVTHDVIDCRKPLVGNFLRLGYVPHQPDLRHPEFGDVTVLSLALRDGDHLRAVRSPFSPVLSEHAQSRTEADHRVHEGVTFLRHHRSV